MLAQKFAFYSVSKVTSVSQKFKTKGDKALEMLETERVSKGGRVTRGGCKKRSEVEGEERYERKSEEKAKMKKKHAA